MSSGFIYLAGGLTLALGFVLGWAFNDLYHLRDEPDTESKDERVGPTQGTYKSRTEYKPNKKPSAHVITPKSPQMLEWEQKNKKPDLVKPK